MIVEVDANPALYTAEAVRGHGDRLLAFLAAALDARADALLAEFVPRADEVFNAVSGKLRNR